jgi:hypothetical protein
MNLILRANQSELVEYINEFNHGYHSDFFTVKPIAASYFDKPNEDQALSLARSLIAALCNWGACRRRAPSLRTEELIASALLDEKFLNSIKFFLKTKISDLKILQGRPEVGVHEPITPNIFGEHLIGILNFLSNAVFNDATNITYPMKTLLLLTGFMPAWDSKVRRGLYLSGFRGTNFTSFLLPNETNSTLAKKIISLPFYLGDFYRENQKVLEAAAKSSDYPELIHSPGRLLDIIFYTQGDTNDPLVSSENPSTKWYNLMGQF